MELETLLDATDVAALLKIKVQAVREFCRERTRIASTNPLPAIRLHKKAIRFRRADIERWLEQCAQASQHSNRL